jgi:acyl-CoA dehydrogenase
MDAKLHTVMIPEEYGGMGLGLREACVIVEEMHRSGGVGSMIHGQMFMMGILARHGTDEQKRSDPRGGVRRPGAAAVLLADRARRGHRHRQAEDQGCQGRQRVGDQGPEALDLALRLHRRVHGVRPHQRPKDPAKPHQGISAFLVDKRKVDPKQYTSRKIDVMFNHHTYEVFYDNMRVPETSLIGEEGKGFKYLLDGLNAERIIIASEAIGDGRWFVEKAVNYAKERVLFGRPIGANQGVQFPIALGYAHLEAADALRWKAAEKFDRHEPCGGDANIAKMLASDASWELANVCMQTHGGFGLAREYHIERASAIRASSRSRRSRPTWC